MRKSGERMEAKFQTEQELYHHVMPALRAKCMDFKRHQMPYIKEEDIWNYLKEIKWKKARDLSLYEMVDDVLNIDDIVIDSYIRGKMNLKNREIYFKEE